MAAVKNFAAWLLLLVALAAPAHGQGQYYRPEWQPPPGAAPAEPGTGGRPGGVPEFVTRPWVDVYCIAWGLGGLVLGLILMKWMTGSKSGGGGH